LPIYSQLKALADLLELSLEVKHAPSHSARVKLCTAWILSGWLGICSCLAQTEIPPNPIITPKSKSRSVGGSVNPGALIDPGKSDQPTVRYVTHVVLFDYRMWSSAEGKPLEAKLIAFEDLIVETPKGAAEPVMPPPPAKPTVVRNGKIRLLIDQKPVEVALSRLCQADRDFIVDLEAALAKKAAK
jgi:hypothetical protein